MEPVTFTTISIVGLTLTLAIISFQWWIKYNDNKQKAKDDRKKEISDAINSGDVSRINNIIQRMRK